MMQIDRLYAFEVEPQRTSDTKAQPAGGSIRGNPGFKTTLAELVESSNLKAESQVDFRNSSRASASDPQQDVRDALMKMVFGTSQTAASRSHTLARRLADSMDGRSHPVLFVISTFKEEAKGRIVLWAFPKDEAFQFEPGEHSANVKVLEDVFSSSSNLRKAAMFEGKDTDTDFFRGRIIDRQIGGKAAFAADYWIETFLDCRYALSSDHGTALLADRLKSAFKAVDSQEDREQVINATVGIRTMPSKDWSLDSFASQFLAGEAKVAFQGNLAPEVRKSRFRFKRDHFERKLSFRTFCMTDDVVLSAPFGVIGKSVQLTESASSATKLRYAGTVAQERVGARRA